MKYLNRGATFIKKAIWLIFALVVIAIGLNWAKVTLNERFDKPCYQAVLPNLHLCLPRDYFMFKNFPSKSQVAYNWETYFLPVNDDTEGGNELALMIPRTVLPVLPLDYDDGNRGMVGIFLRPLYLPIDKRQSQFEEFKGNVVFKTDEIGTFIHCDHYDHRRGNPSAKKYCLIKMDWDARIINPRIELSFSIAINDFEHWRDNAEKVRAFLHVYTITSPTSTNQFKQVSHD